MWKNNSVSILLPTYREKDSLKFVIEKFESLNLCDEIIVVNNNAEDGTSAEVAKTTAKELHEIQQGYGAAIKCGLRYCHGDLIVICEPDSTFEPEDLLKLLPFTDRADSVYGSRTVDNFIWTGANMGPFLKWGNWFVAKLIEILFNSAYLSDVGCTFRILKASALKDLDLDKFKDDGRFGMELLLAQVMKRDRVVQVPVNYLPRVGISGYTGDIKGAFFLGMKMIVLIFQRRFLGKRSHYEKG